MVVRGDIQYRKLPPEERESIGRRMAEAASALDGVALLVAYGSFTEGRPFRDVDVAVLLEEPISWHSIGPVEGALQRALDELDLPLDLVPLNDAPPHFRAAVLDRGWVLYQREPRTATEEWVRAKSESLDFDAWRQAHGVPCPPRRPFRGR